MFLSKLTLDVRHDSARRDLAHMYELHKTILSKGFDGIVKDAIGRVLFRVDYVQHDAPIVLVQTSRLPDWSRLEPGYLRWEPETKPFDPWFEIGQQLQFRLRANPTKREPHVQKSRRLAHISEEGQIEWLIRKGQLSGFKLLGDWIESNDPVTAKPRRFPNFSVAVRADGRSETGKCAKGWLLAVHFEGVIEITDRKQFHQAIERGIGSGKGYGFGLLSVAPIVDRIKVS